LGYLDGYCAGEPWASVAAEAGVGVCVASSAELAPLHPEKVLMARQSFALGRAEEHQRLLAALLEACAFCDQPQNRPLLSDMLSHPNYVNAPADCLRPGLIGSLDSGTRRIESLLGLSIFHRYQANEPTDEKAAWLMQVLYDSLEQSLVKRKQKPPPPVFKNVFRRDIYHRAKSLVLAETRQLSVEARTYEMRAVEA
jgi:NitT/TauT family transport system ATP-binding protein